MNDIVITYDKQINTENRLRQIIRAIENECTGYNEIFIVGDKPDWLQGVVHIDFSNTESRKFFLKNQYKKLRAAALNTSLTENFYWIDANDNIPAFCAEEPLRVSVSEKSNFFIKPNGYDKISYQHTKNIMSRRGFTEYNYFNCYPISLNKDKLKNTFDDIDFETAYGYCIKTLYCNFNRLKPTNEILSCLDLTKYIQTSTYEKI